MAEKKQKAKAKRKQQGVPVIAIVLVIVVIVAIVAIVIHNKNKEPDIASDGTQVNQYAANAKNADDIFLYYKNNQDKIKGEFVIIIEKTNTNDKLDLKNMDNIMKNSLKYMSVKDSSEFLSDILKLKKNEIYKRLLIFKEK